MTHRAVATRPVGRAELADLAGLFGGERSARHCWCMAFCTSRARFAAGWYGGGNRRAFEAMATSSPTPVGVLASIDAQPVGWCACGPRSRYVAAITGRAAVLRGRPRVEDDAVWLLPCVFVAAEHRGRGVASALVRAAVDVARRAGARAVEGWPLAASVGRSADAHLGREPVFAALGFDCVDRPSTKRVVMRLELAGP